MSSSLTRFSLKEASGVATSVARDVFYAIILPLVHFHESKCVCVLSLIPSQRSWRHLPSWKEKASISMRLFEKNITTSCNGSNGDVKLKLIGKQISILSVEHFWDASFASISKVRFYLSIKATIFC
jgi:hypothetical protein